MKYKLNQNKEIKPTQKISLDLQKTGDGDEHVSTRGGIK
jgi:hypothetical protein